MERDIEWTPEPWKQYRTSVIQFMLMNYVSSYISVSACCTTSENFMPASIRSFAHWKKRKLAGKRWKWALKRIAFRDVSRGAAQHAALIDIQETLRSADKLSFPKKDLVICIFTDASEEFLSAVITQAHNIQSGTKIKMKIQRPMGFPGGRLTKSQRNWSTYEKEAYTILSTFQRMDYVLFGPQPVHKFTDHRNLLFVFESVALRPRSS